jgi:hypothetical protein
MATGPANLRNREEELVSPNVDRASMTPEAICRKARRRNRFPEVGMKLVTRSAETRLLGSNPAYEDMCLFVHLFRHDSECGIGH